MVPALPDSHRDETEFDLDVRLEAVARHAADKAALKPTDAACPDATQTQVGTCTIHPS